MSQSARRDLLNQAVASGLIADCAAYLVARAGKIEQTHIGTSDAETEYDLASLSKIFCTTYLVAQAVVAKKIELDEQPWPGWPGVSIEQVLAHTSGLPSWKEISSIADALAVKPIEKPGTQTLYSDIGFIALGALLEKRLGTTLDRLYVNHALHFHGKHTVDDANCQRLGGVAGHAGLFGTLEGVCKESLFFLQCLTNPKTELEYVIKSFAEYPGPRGLGFDKPTPEGSTGGVLSPKSVGHLGFTGTSVWIDPEQEAIFVLLTRRLDEGKRAEEMMVLRRAFHITGQ